MQKITPFLWFNDNAEEAAEFYVSVFKNAKIDDVHRYGEGAHVPAGTAMLVKFTLEGIDFIAMNGGPHFQFTPAISLFVDCVDQTEVDELWSRLTADGGKESQCGWLQDKFGLSWQIIPKALGELLGGEDPEGASRAMAAMMGMGKIDVEALRRAYEGG